jgi:hypothetical protein
MPKLIARTPSPQITVRASLAGQEVRKIPMLRSKTITAVFGKIQIPFPDQSVKRG